jgi:hypothetical protein
MSQLTPVLYGNRLYSRVLYSENYDPQTFNVVLSDGVGATDSLTDQFTKVLSDVISSVDSIAKQLNIPLADSVSFSDTLAKNLTQVLNDNTVLADLYAVTATKSLSDNVTLSEVLTTLLTKVLADTITLSDSKTIVSYKVLTDAVASVDSTIITTFTKSLQEILLLQDWISVRLSKPQIWQVSRVIVPTDTLYGRVLYGVMPYSAIGLKPWISIKPVSGNSSWKSYNELERP